MKAELLIAVLVIAYVLTGHLLGTYFLYISSPRKSFGSLREYKRKFFQDDMFTRGGALIYGGSLVAWPLWVLFAVYWFLQDVYRRS